MRSPDPYHLEAVHLSTWFHLVRETTRGLLDNLRVIESTRRWCTEKSKERRESEQQERAEARRTAEAAARLAAANAVAVKAAKADAKAKRKEEERRRARDQANSEAATNAAAVVRLVYCPPCALPDGAIRPVAVSSSLANGELRVSFSSGAGRSSGSDA